MADIVWRRQTFMTLEICLLFIVCAATGARQIPLALSTFSDLETRKLSDPFQAEQSTNECIPYTDNMACTTTVTVNSLSCDFNDEISANETDYWTRRLPICNSTEKSSLWTNVPYYNYQFSRDDQDAYDGPAAVVSNCLNTIFPSSLINSTQAIATLRTGIYPGSTSCEKFHVSFWCKFQTSPNLADDPDRFFLQLALHRQGRGDIDIDGAGLPSRNLWGLEASDYDSVYPGQWKEITLSFTEFEQFSLMFFAHHNDGCNPTRVKTIHLDLVVIKKVLGVTCPTPITTTPNTPTPDTTTLTPNTTTTTPTPNTTTTTPDTTTTTTPTPDTTTTTPTPTPDTTTTTPTPTPTPNTTTTTPNTTTTTPDTTTTTTPTPDTTTTTPTPTPTPNTTTTTPDTTTTPTPNTTTTTPDTTTTTTPTPTPNTTTTTPNTTTPTPTPTPTPTSNTTTTTPTPTPTPNTTTPTPTSNTTTTTPTPNTTTTTPNTTTTTPTPTPTPTPNTTTTTPNTTTPTPTPTPNTTTTTPNTTTPTPTPNTTTTTPNTTTPTPTPTPTPTSNTPTTTPTSNTTTTTPTPNTTTTTPNTTTPTPTPTPTPTSNTTTTTPTPTPTPNTTTPTPTSNTTTTTPTPNTTTTTPNTTTTTPTPTPTPTPNTTTTTPNTTTPTPTPTPNTTTTTPNTTTPTPTPNTTTPNTPTPNTPSPDTLLPDTPPTDETMTVTCQHPWYTNKGTDGGCRCPVSHMQIAINKSIATCQEYPTIVKISLKMETSFTVFLTDTSSRDFKLLAETLSFWAKQTFEPILKELETGAGDFDVIIQSFRNGSIIADTLFRFRENISIPIKTIRSAIINADSSLIGPITLNGEQITTTVSAVDLPFNACTESDQPICFPQNTTECIFDSETEKSWCQCLPGHVRVTPYTCKYDPCGASPCGKNAKCLINAVANRNQRVCACLNGYSRASGLPEDAVCEKDSLIPITLIIGISALFGIILLVVILIFCIQARKRPSSKSRKAENSGRRDATEAVTVISQKNQRHNARYVSHPWPEQINMEILPELDCNPLDPQMVHTDTSGRLETFVQPNDPVHNIYDVLKPHSSTESVISEPGPFGRNNGMSTFGFALRQPHRLNNKGFMTQSNYPF